VAGRTNTRHDGCADRHDGTRLDVSAAPLALVVPAAGTAVIVANHRSGTRRTRCWRSPEALRRALRILINSDFMKLRRFAPMRADRTLGGRGRHLTKHEELARCAEPDSEGGRHHLVFPAGGGRDAEQPSARRGAVSLEGVHGRLSAGAGRRVCRFYSRDRTARLFSTDQPIQPDAGLSLMVSELRHLVCATIRVAWGRRGAGCRSSTWPGPTVARSPDELYDTG